MPTPVNQIRAGLPQQQYGTPITTSHLGPVHLQGHGQPPPIPPGWFAGLSLRGAAYVRRRVTTAIFMT